YFRWLPQPFAGKYELELYKNGDLMFTAVNRLLTAQTKMAAYSPIGMFPAGMYAWRVRRIDASNRPGPWSSGRTFRLQPAAPALLAPADGAAPRNGEMLFQWSGVIGASLYLFESSQSSSFSSVAEQQRTVMTSYAPTRLYADGTHYWRVKVVDAAGNVLATSATRRITRDATRPTVATKTPTSAAPLSGPFSVTFSEPVKQISTTTFTMVIAGTTTKVAGRVSPGATTSTSSASFTPSAPLMPGQSYTLALSSGITDGAGNTLVPLSWTVRTSLAVDSASPVVKYVWDRDTHSSASGGAYSASQKAGSRKRFTFTGTNVAIVGRRAPDGGYADVYLDGVKQAPALNFYSASAQWRVTMWSRTGLTNRSHTLEVVVRGTRPSGSKGAWVYLDAYQIGTTMYQENHVAVRDQFRRVTTTSASGGSYDVANHVATSDAGTQPYLELRFKGTGIDWYASRMTTGGEASVYLDGALAATVDLYASSTSYNTRMWSSASLTDGVHTLKIVVTGTRGTASTGTDVTFDSFTVR
ncbi:MAG: Ig-like domain-containing protein, partial [Chloroflexi bacterium]|nr:Ig-like domain-containing protein [Chloroflexota bacterium]